MIKNASESKTKQQIIEQLQKSKEKLVTLKNNLNQQKILSKEMYRACIKRIGDEKNIIKKSQQTNKHLAVQEFDKQIIQFFASRNKIKQAQIIQNSLKNKPDLSVEIYLYEKAYKIISSIQKNDLRPLKDWCYQHSHYLNKIKSSLEFKLISCSFVNILNNSNGTKAIEFLRNQVSTLILRQHDKEELNKLTFMPLITQNQTDYSYYSDSQKQQNQSNHKNATNSKKISPIQSTLAQKPKGQQQQQSSSNSDEAFKNTEQTMTSIYRAMGQLTQGLAQGVQKGVQKVIKKISRNKSIQHKKYQQINIGSSEEDRYSNSWESVSQNSNDDQEKQAKEEQQDEDSNQLNKKDKEKKSTKIMEKSKQNLLMKEKQQIQEKCKNRINENIGGKQCVKKNKLDKNNLRKLLIQTKLQFISAFSKIYQLSFDTFFQKTLTIGISIIKTPYCSQSEQNDKNQHYRGGCPTCAKQINRIMKKIPGIHKNQSSLICRINFSFMNAENYPVVLPNGQIYSLSGLQSISKHGKYYCIIQNKWYSKEECRKVFLT